MRRSSRALVLLNVQAGYLSRGALTMSDSIRRLPPDQTPTDGGLRAPPGLGPLGKFWWWFHFLILVKLARLRFIAVLALVGLVILKWDTLNAWYEKWNRPTLAKSDKEFFCPMHPQIVRDHPDKCPLCGMPLSERHRNEDAETEALPTGVVSRVQLTPYRMALAGLETSEVTYEALTKEIRTVGFIEFDERKLKRISVRLTGKSRIDKLHVNVTGQMIHEGDPLALLYNPDLVVTVQNLVDAQRTGNRDLERLSQDRLRLWGIEEDQIKHILHKDKDTTHLVIRSPLTGHIIKKHQVEGAYVDEGAALYEVADLSTVWLEAQVFEDELAFLHKGLEARATTTAYPDRLFRGRIAFVHPHLDAATRTLRVRFDMDNADHALRPGMNATVQLAVPTARLEVFGRTALEDWRDETALADLGLGALAGPAPAVGLQPLLNAAIGQALLKRRLVLAIPESAVIDTGRRQFVYREAWPGVYDCLQVWLGPRSGDYFPVVRGLEAGDRVVTTGSFLVDAETRLSGGMAAAWLGTSSGPGAGRPSAGRSSLEEDEAAVVLANLAKLSSADRKLAEAQMDCPVLGTRLGTMGLPVKVILKGQPVFLCCKGCERRARADPDKTLAEVERLKARTSAPRAAVASARTKAAKISAAPGSRTARIRAALAKLSPDDRRMAEAQRYCAVLKNNRLGAMGTPVKVEVEGQSVFLCCTGCEEEARAHPRETLEAARRLKAAPGKALAQ
jgi:Cu(I)/Ag(I) efflux system membrane fusion protein